MCLCVLHNLSLSFLFNQRKQSFFNNLSSPCLAILPSFRARNSKVQQGMEEGEHGEAGEDLAALDKDYEEY